MEKVMWYFKQLFPFMYYTEYGQDGKKKVTVWRMWFGRCFNIKEWTVI